MKGDFQKVKTIMGKNNGNDRQLATVEPSVAQLLAGVIEKGITADNVAALEQLCDLKLKVDANNAQKEFASAFVELQSELPTIEATKPVPNNDGTVRYRFAPYEEIMREVAPLLARHGFTISFDSRFNEGRYTVICTLMHKSGHSRNNEFAVRIGKGPPGASEPQADGSAKTYAKRGALCDCLNIVVDHSDDDARLIGPPIGKALAIELRDRVKATNSDEQIFLKYAGVTCSDPPKLSDYEAIPDNRYDSLDAMLKRKERGAPGGSQGKVEW